MNLVLCVLLVSSIVLLPQPENAVAAGVIQFGAATPGAEDARINHLDTLEDRIGRQLDFVRVFEVWDSPFPTAYHDLLIDSDRGILLSVRARLRNGSSVAWRDIADAPAGSPMHNQIVRWVEAVRNINKPVWFSFNHEPEVVGNTSNGTAADFIAAWRRIVGEFQARGVNNVEFVWIMTGYSFRVPPSDPRHAPHWYPGDDVVDHIAADAYNYSTCRAGINTPWRSLEYLITPLREFGSAHPDKGLMLAEWASSEPGGDKAAWITEAAALLKKPGWEQFIAIAYYDQMGTYPNCAWPVTSSPQSLAAFQTMAADPFYGGGDDPPPTVSVAAPAMGATVSGTVTVSASASDDKAVTSVNFLVDGTSEGTDSNGADGWSVQWNTANQANGSHAISAVATDTVGQTTTSATVNVIVSNTGSAVLMVVANPAALLAGETAVRNRLIGSGYLVTVVDDNVAVVADANGKAFVLLSSSITVNSVAATFRNVTIPVWVAKPYFFDDFGMTGPTADVDYGSKAVSAIQIVNATHPMAAGLSGTVALRSGTYRVSFGVAAASATVVASADGPATIFTLTAGAQLAGGTGTAAGCRLTFPIFQDVPQHYNSNAWTMFDSAATFAAGGCP